jgi:4-hydroxybenzoate polyprenyltransferase
VQKNRNVHLTLFIIGLIGSGIFFFYLLPYWHWLLLSAIITFLYSAPKIPHPLFRALRKVALGKTIFLALVWMNVTTLLPILISGEPWRNDFTLFIVSRFFLIYAICILFDYRDREDDKAAGIRSLITYLSEKGILYLFIFSLVIFAVSTVSLYPHGYTILSIIILLIPGIITACLYNYAKRNFSDLFYYFVLDGLMAFSALLMLIPFN